MIEDECMNRDTEAIDRAIVNLHPRRAFTLASGQEILVACLIRVSDWKPLRASWWKGKEVSIIGVALNGSFLLRHSNGSVRYWDHSAQSDLTIAASVGEFCAKLKEELETK